jgi:hypothetical protein
MIMFTESAPPRPALEEEKPEYGTCPNCTRGIRVDKFGLLREHETPIYAYGVHSKASFRCPGSRKTYTEKGPEPHIWSHRDGRWERLALDVPVLIQPGGDLDHARPTWQYTYVPWTDAHEQGLARVNDGTYRIEMVIADGVVEGGLFTRQGDRIGVWSEQFAQGGLHLAAGSLLRRVCQHEQATT